MEALKVKVKELTENQDHMLNAIKFLKEKLEDVTKKLNCEVNDVKNVQKSQEMVDSRIVTTSDEIVLIKKTKEENIAAIKILDTKINKIEKEIESRCKASNDNDKSRFQRFSSPINCEYCEKTFMIISELENHIRNSHEMHSKFKCDQCDKNFVSRWRLKKHINIHNGKVTTHCHYFNNKKSCPFQDLGCKFLHKISKLCNFGQTCRKQNCPFRHEIKDNNTMEEVSELIDISENGTAGDLTNIDVVEETVKFNASKHDIENEGKSFVTSTPFKRKHRCEECNDKSQCIDCFVMQHNSTHEMSPKRHRVHFSDIY